MKRILTLLLAALLCLPAIPAGAAPARFADWDLVRQKAAVTMMADLGLVTGYQDGSFQPYRGVTRAEAVKMITGLLTAEPIEDTACRYPDADAHWAGKYVEFCAEKGILSGRAGSNFRPQDGVTCRELAKMLLVCLGYRTDSYVGDTWADAVDRDAVASGIYDGVEYNRSRPVSREGACQLINNSLQCSVVDGYDEAGEPRYVLDDMLQPKSLLEVHFAVVPAMGWVQADAVADLREDSPGLISRGIHLNGYAKDFRVSAEVANDESLLGHQVVVYARFGREFNEVMGIPGIHPAEISHTLNGQKALEAIMSIQSLKMDKATLYFLDLEPAGDEIVKKLTDSQEITIIDHEGDKLVDVVLVKSSAAGE